MQAEPDNPEYRSQRPKTAHEQAPVDPRLVERHVIGDDRAQKFGLCGARRERRDCLHRRTTVRRTAVIKA